MCIELLGPYQGHVGSLLGLICAKWRFSCLCCTSFPSTLLLLLGPPIPPPFTNFSVALAHTSLISPLNLTTQLQMSSVCYLSWDCHQVPCRHTTPHWHDNSSVTNNQPQNHITVNKHPNNHGHSRLLVPSLYCFICEILSRNCTPCFDNGL